MDEGRTSVCSNCGHAIIKLRKGWGHLKGSELQNEPHFDQDKKGNIDKDCKVSDCNCHFPEE